MKKKKEILSEKYYRRKKIFYFACLFGIAAMITIGLSHLVNCNDREKGLIFCFFLLFVLVIGFLISYRKSNLEEHYAIYQVLKEKENSEQKDQPDSDTSSQ